MFLVTTPIALLFFVELASMVRMMLKSQTQIERPVSQMETRERGHLNQRKIHMHVSISDKMLDVIDEEIRTEQH